MESIYQKKILNLAQHYKTFKKIKTYNNFAEVNNTTCGDKVIAKILLKDRIIIDMGIDVWGCALCEAGAGLWLRNVLNLNVDNLIMLEDDINNWITNKKNYTNIMELNKFKPIKKFKNRHKCVMLAFNTAKKFTEIK